MMGITIITPMRQRYFYFRINESICLWGHNNNNKKKQAQLQYLSLSAMVKLIA
jgi:hypothetical protein